MEQVTLSAVENQIGYRFHNSALLLTALTHKSYPSSEETPNNERLEFLGDALLGAAVSRLLYLRYPNESEGTLSLFKQHLVCNETLASIAEELHLCDFLRLGEDEESNGGRKKKSLLANATEALTAAVYLDAGENGEAAVIKMLSLLLNNEIENCPHLSRTDYKSRLQQFVERGGQELLSYRQQKREGPDNAPYFTMEACLNRNVIGQGSGRTKKEAEQAAAKEALLLFGVSDAEPIDITAKENGSVLKNS